MDKVSLLFGVHMHQPVDNFGNSVDEAIEKCYKPFFATMVNYPEFKFSVHCSGWLLEQIITKHKDIYENMKILTDARAIEWVSAGYYEPVLSSIPSNDRINQIKKLSNYINKKFHTKPNGLWLTERVWESSLVPDLKKSSSGFDKKRMDGYFETEESGDKLALFPICGALRYALPFFSVKRAIEAIEIQKKDSNSAAIIFDDAEKFGLWPKTYEWVYEQKWLKKFVEAVIKNKKIKSEHFNNYLKTHKSHGIAYLNNTSYFEMGEWSLRENQALGLEALKKKVGLEYFEDIGISFIKGGIWKNFFVKYKESNYLHKRMLYMSKKQKKMSKKILEFLYKLQTNDVFWHGVFGGLYLPNLRDNAYKYLLELEKTFAGKKIQTQIEDFDMDGFDELKVLTSSLSLMFSSKNGGQMVEFGSLDVLFNWQNTIKRRKEAYHEKILNPKESQKRDVNTEEISTIHNISGELDEELKNNLIFDWHLKNSFIDHISNALYNIENFKNANFKEIGDFANQPFKLDNKKNLFTRNGGIYIDGTFKTQIKKEYLFKDKSLEMSLAFKSEFDKIIYYGIEFNFHFAHPHLVTFNDNLINDGLNLKNINSLNILDDFTNKKLKLSSNLNFDLNAFILKTVSQSESGFDMVAQQISFIISYEFHKNLELIVNLEVCNV